MVESKTPRERVLNEAAELITGDRNKTYGSPTENFANTAALWSVQIGHKLRDPITAAEVAQMMVQLKMARMIAQPKRDNYVDAAGYIACGAECEDFPEDSTAPDGPCEEDEPLGGDLVYTCAPSASPMPPARYAIDWTWYYREKDGILTYSVPGSPFVKYSSRYESLDELLHHAGGSGIREIPIDRVPEWAR